MKTGFKIGIIKKIQAPHNREKPVFIYGAPSRIRTCAPGSGDRCSIP